MSNDRTKEALAGMSPTNLTKVYATKDDSGHWYLIPAKDKYLFDYDMDHLDDDNCFHFDDKWGKYRTGGDINNIQLYADLNSKL